MQGFHRAGERKPGHPGKAYGMLFGFDDRKDMVRAQKNLLDFLGIESLHAVVGGSMGGMQALQWIVEFPGFVEKALIIAATARHNAQTIAFNEVVGVRSAATGIGSQGDYLDGKGPREEGLAVARMMAHITIFPTKVWRKGSERSQGIQGQEL